MFHVICGNPHLNQKFEKFKYEKVKCLWAQAQMTQNNLSQVWLEGEIMLKTISFVCNLPII